MDKLSFRRATPTDALHLSLLADFSFRTTFTDDFEDRRDLDDYCTRTFAYDKIKGSLTNAGNYFLLAILDHEVVGYAKLKLRERPVQLQKFYFHPAFLGRGFGKALLERSKDVAREAGAKKLWLAVEQRNQNAITFYRRTGWATTGAFDLQIGSQVFNFFRMELDLRGAGQLATT